MHPSWMSQSKLLLQGTLCRILWRWHEIPEGGSQLDLAKSFAVWSIWIKSGLLSDSKGLATVWCSSRNVSSPSRRLKVSCIHNSQQSESQLTSLRGKVQKCGAWSPCWNPGTEGLAAFPPPGCYSIGHVLQLLDSADPKRKVVFQLQTIIFHRGDRYFPWLTTRLTPNHCMARTCCVAGTVSLESWLNEVRWNSTGRVASEVSRCFR